MDDPLNWTAAEQERALRAIAPWYELDFGGLSDDLEMYLELAAPGAQILELGAGSGRIAAPLAEHGCRVVALDSSDAMLAAGEARMRKAGVEPRRGDMRRLSLDESFDLVILGLSTVQHLLRRADQLAALRAARRQLADGGRLIIDWTAPRADDLDPRPSILQLEWVREAPSGELVSKSAAQEPAVIRRQGSALDRALAIAWITYQYDALNESGLLRRSLARFPLRVNLTAGEMAGLLAESSLQPLHWFGSWQFDEVGDGDRLIVVAEAAA